MATESIFHNFTITDPEAVKRFVEAMEKAIKTQSRKHKHNSSVVTSPDKIREFFDKKD